MDNLSMSVGALVLIGYGIFILYIAKGLKGAMQNLKADLFMVLRRT